MGIENIWEDDVFSTYSLTSAIEELPIKFGMVRGSGLFKVEPIPTTVAVLEKRDGVLGLVPNTPRGGPGVTPVAEKREVRAYPLTHLPENDSVKADDVQNIRAFGSETQLMQITSLVNNKLQRMKDNLEITREHLLCGALQGNILDADGTTVLANLFTDYGVTREAVDFALGTSTTDVRGKCLAVKRLVEKALGGRPLSGVKAYATDTFFDKLIKHAEVKAAYANWASNEMLRNDPRSGFTFGGIEWVNYDPYVGTRSFFTDGDANVFPVGTSGVFSEYVGPADYVETVNTMGREYYAKKEATKFNKGVDLEAQSNPFPICNIPLTLVRAYSSD